MKKILTAAIFTVALMQAPANAAVVVQSIFAAGDLSLPSGVLEDFDTHVSNPAVFVGADLGVYTGTASVITGSIDAVSAAPYFGNPGQDTTPYLTIAAGQTETISYTATKGFFGLYWGSVDSYNTIDFLLNGNPVGSFTGNSLIPTLSATGNQTNFVSNRYITFAGDFNQIILGSGQTNAFELDNIVTRDSIDRITPGAPELSTWAMMLLGFAGIGFAAYRRRGSFKTVAA